MYILCQIHKYMNFSYHGFEVVKRFKKTFSAFFQSFFFLMWQLRRVLSMFISYREFVSKITDRHEET